MVTVDDRITRRQKIRDRELAAAQARADTLGRTLTCQWGRHPTCVGPDCLCECHDPQEAP